LKTTSHAGGEADLARRFARSAAFGFAAFCLLRNVEAGVNGEGVFDDEVSALFGGGFEA
jgi:hypothetical protein